MPVAAPAVVLPSATAPGNPAPQNRLSVIRPLSNHPSAPPLGTHLSATRPFSTLLPFTAPQ